VLINNTIDYIQKFTIICTIAYRTQITDAILGLHVMDAALRLSAIYFSYSTVAAVYMFILIHDLYFFSLSLQWSL